MKALLLLLVVMLSLFSLAGSLSGPDMGLAYQAAANWAIESDIKPLEIRYVENTDAEKSALQVEMILFYETYSPDLICSQILTVQWTEETPDVALIDKAKVPEPLCE